ncbi:ferredoxin--NADP reductase [Moraxella sp. VT-16-12]|uniref:ferredoxin--NADP reductase n=1 Tax=Moraxella sp. VT-16-12 TaxID=2014877 RepID=UPI000B8020B9|nr:ferredoxin--NADP reductase [Moraxella sp. VT-16-12]TWV81596.1 ferredoxin--NADP reductase [Moraxella sp. VT-16-12]
MSKFIKETVTYVHHWTDSLFTIKTTRSDSLRFRSGEFAMIGLEVDGKPLVRAYSIASPAWAEELEFYSIKVQNGPLTSRLQHIKVGDELLVSKKPTGTLVLDDLLPGKNLYMLATGTGLAPFLSLVREPEVYERFEKVILVHGVRHVEDLAYREMFENDLPNDEIFGEWVREKFIYYPTVTRDEFKHTGRVTELLKSGKLFEDIGLPPISKENDRVMICGSMAMNADTSAILDEFGLTVSPRMGVPADYVVERAFVG